MADEEEDDFQPLKKKNKRIKGHGQQKKTVATKDKKTSKKTKPDETTNKKSNEGKRKTPKSKTPLRERKKYDGFCPNCQMPYSILVIQTPSWHLDECLDKYHPETECVDGVDCDCTIQSHYWKYNHEQLAKKRNNKGSNKKSKVQLTYGNPEVIHTNKQKTNISDTGLCIPNTSPFDELSQQRDGGPILYTGLCMPCDELTGQKEIRPIPDKELCIPATSPCDELSQQRECRPIPNASLCIPATKSCGEMPQLKECIPIPDTSLSVPNTSPYGGVISLTRRKLTPEDACEYLEAAFKEATHCSHTKNTDSVIDDNEEAERELMNSFLYEDSNPISNPSQSFCDCGQGYVEHSGKSVSDVDASEDSNSNSRSFFLNYKKKLTENLQSGTLKGTDVNDSGGTESQFYRNIFSLKRTEESDSKHLNDDEYLSGNEADGGNLGETESEKDIFFENEADGLNLGGNKFRNGTLSEENDSDVQLMAVEDNTRSNCMLSSQKSETSKSQSSSNKQSTSKNMKTAIKKSQGKKNKLPKENTDKNQMSLLTFFKGNKSLASVKSYCDFDLKIEENSSNSGTIANCCNSNGDDLTKLKSINNVLMNSLTKSKSDPCAMSKHSYSGSQVRNTSMMNSTQNSSQVRNTSDVMMNSAKNTSLVKNASDILMNSAQNREKSSQNVASNNKSEDPSTEGTEKEAKPTRNCPFYKKIPGTGFTVDAFLYGSVPDCVAYFLSHFHYDHYRGLTKKFTGQIYCSQITGNLIKSRLGVRPDIVHCLPMETPCTVEGTEVTLLEANHCPGAVLFLFKTKQGQIILHTGDFRADPAMEQYKCLQNVKVHQLYLDTTYCDPQYVFPPQNEVIEFGVKLVEKFMIDHPNTAVICGSYTIGKERIFTAIAKKLGCKICVQRDKYKVLNCLEDTDLSQRISLDYNESFLHVLPMGKLMVSDLQEHLSKLKKKYDHVIAISPTGWNHSNKLVSLNQIKPKGTKNIKIYGLPYSEHSSYSELKRFVQFLRPKQILPTVNNGNPASRKKMERIFHSWMTEESDIKPKQTMMSSWTK